MKRIKQTLIHNSNTVIFILKLFIVHSVEEKWLILRSKLDVGLRRYYEVF